VTNVIGSRFWLIYDEAARCQATLIGLGGSLVVIVVGDRSAV
jgi:hypothetical protein